MNGFAQRLMRSLRALVLALCCSASLAAVNWDAPNWEDVEQLFIVQPDGTVDVQDIRSGRVGSFTELSICVHHPETATVRMRSEHSGLIDPPGNVRLRQGPCAFGTELFIEFEEQITSYSARVQFAYTIENSITFHEDVAEWQWRILETAENILWNYQANIVFPASMPSPYDASLRSYSLLGTPDVTWLGIRRELLIEQIAVMRGNAYDVRAIMPPQVFTEKGRGRALQAILDEERTYQDLNRGMAPLLSINDIETAINVGKRFEITGKTSQSRHLQPITITAQVGYEKPRTCQLREEGRFTCRITLTRAGPAEVIISAVDNVDRRSTRLVQVDTTQRPATPVAQTQIPPDTTHGGSSDTTSSTPTQVPTPAPMMLTTDEAVQYSAIGYLAILALGILATFLSTDRSAVKSAPRRVFTAPLHIRPQYAEIQHVRFAGQPMVQRAFLAILFELARRGHLTTQQDGSHMMIRLHPNPDKSFVQSELRVLEFLAQYGREDGILRGPVVQRLLRIAGRSFTSQLRTDLTKEVQGLPGQAALPTRSISGATVWALLALIGIIGWSVVLAQFSNIDGFWPTVAILGSIVLGNIAALALPAYQRAASEHRQHWKAYVATLKDPAAYSEAPREFFEQWDRHLAYATAAGVVPRYCFLLLRANANQTLPTQTMRQNAAWLRNVGVVDMSTLQTMLNEFAEYHRFFARSITGLTAQVHTPIPPLPPKT